MLNPFTAFWNKDYHSSVGKIILKNLISLKNSLDQDFDNNLANSGIFFADDCFVGLRNLGFLQDDNFVRALGPRANDPILMGRIWRLWIVSWSLSKWGDEGMIIDLARITERHYEFCKYACLSNPKVNLKNKRIIAADLFETGRGKRKNMAHCFETVKNQFRGYPKAEIIKGLLPFSLADTNFDQGISWCQIV